MAAADAGWGGRLSLGELLGWDGPDEAGHSPSLRERLPADLRSGRCGDADPLPLELLYQTGDEWAAEIANRTVHGVLHLSWVPDATGTYRGQLAIYVKRHGLLGAAYMAAITPFRYGIVYPAMMRQIEQEWREHTEAPAHVTHRRRRRDG